MATNVYNPLTDEIGYIQLNGTLSTGSAYIDYFYTDAIQCTNGSTITISATNTGTSSAIMTVSGYSTQSTDSYVASIGYKSVSAGASFTQSYTVSNSSINYFRVSSKNTLSIDYIYVVSPLKQLTITATSLNNAITLTVSPSKVSGNVYRYKGLVSGASASTVETGDSVMSGWSSWNGTNAITNRNYERIEVCEADGQLNAVGYGIATIQVIPPPELDDLTVSANESDNAITVSVSPSLTSGNSYRIKGLTSSETEPSISYGTNLSSWTSWNGTSTITNNDYVKMAIAEVDSSNQAVKYGIATITSNENWTTTPQETTPTKKYLWNYQVINYTDGTTQIVQPRIIGTYGDTGETGAQGPQGADGADGADGDDGKSAYESAVDGGYSGTESQFNTDLADVSNKAPLTIIREYSSGVLVGKTGNTVGSLVNANGSFDVVNTTWSGITPTAGTVYATFGSNNIRLGLSNNKNVSVDTTNGFCINNGSITAGSIYAYKGGESITSTNKGIYFESKVSANELSRIELVGATSSHSSIALAVYAGGTRSEVFFDNSIFSIPVNTSVRGTLSATGALSGGSISTTGALSAGAISNASTLFARTNHTFTISSIAKDSTSGATTKTFTKSGYYPVGIVGFQTGGGKVCFARMEITSASSGSVTITYNAYNGATTASGSLSASVAILWVKTS